MCVACKCVTSCRMSSSTTHLYLPIVTWLIYICDMTHVLMLSHVIYLSDVIYYSCHYLRIYCSCHYLRILFLSLFLSPSFSLSFACSLSLTHSCELFMSLFKWRDLLFMSLFKDLLFMSLFKDLLFMSLFKWRDLFLYVTWHIYICDMTHLHVMPHM